ncbi:hypothetical protein FE249_19660 (plasmid) [Acidiphilium multivorum]|nr:hypothetical protein FE249_19660 [Acidiphilium multivorum]
MRGAATARQSGSTRRDSSFGAPAFRAFGPGARSPPESGGGRSLDRIAHRPRLCRRRAVIPGWLMLQNLEVDPRGTLEGPVLQTPRFVNRHRALDPGRGDDETPDRLHELCQARLSCLSGDRQRPKCQPFARSRIFAVCPELSGDCGARGPLASDPVPITCPERGLHVEKGSPDKPVLLPADRQQKRADDLGGDLASNSLIRSAAGIPFLDPTDEGFGIAGGGVHSSEQGACGGPDAHCLPVVPPADYLAEIHRGTPSNASRSLLTNCVTNKLAMGFPGAEAFA